MTITSSLNKTPYLPKRTYTLRPDIPVPNEKLIESLPAPSESPQSLILSSKFPLRVWDQGDTNSCTAQTMCAIYYYFNQVDASRLFQYYNERLLLNMVNQDVGVSLRDAVTALFDYGICPEEMMPFTPVGIETKPSPECYQAATLGNISAAAKFNTQNPSFIAQLKNSMVLGFAPAVGIAVYPSMETEEVAETGIVPLPNDTEQTIGGHLVPLIGYDDTKQSFLFRNSWGTQWGLHGNGYLSYDYVRTYCISAWAISSKPFAED